MTPIGALSLRSDQAGFYFDEYPSSMPETLRLNPRVCILAVNTDKQFWARSLMDGKFSTPPAVRLMGTVGKSREATSEEIAKWQERIALAKGLKGYHLMWEQMGRVRDIWFEALRVIHGDSPQQNLRTIKKFGPDKWVEHRHKPYVWQ